MQYSSAKRETIDREIASRLRDFRRLTKLARTVVALTVRIGSERLASYEAGRARVKYIVVEQMMCHFNLNPIWLATGEGSPFVSESDLIKEVFEKDISLDRHAESPFAAVYFEIIAPLLPAKELALQTQAEAKARALIKALHEFEKRSSDPDFGKALPDALRRKLISTLDTVIAGERKSLAQISPRKNKTRKKSS